MKSKYEPTHPKHIIENINYNNQISSNKKCFSRNSASDENDFIDYDYLSKSFNSFDKNKNEKRSNEEHNSQISNQYNNKKFTNNIINYCLINPNHNMNKKIQSNNFYYNMESDILKEDEKHFPKPEPTPLKINKTTKYINISKNFEANNKVRDNIKNNGDNRLITFLHHLNLDFLLDNFKNNYINFNDLFLLTKEDLIEMKIPIGPRNKLIYFIEQYKKSMKSFDIEDINYFFRFNNTVQNIEMISSTVPSTYNNDSSNRIKENVNVLFFNPSETKRGYNTKDKILNKNNEINIINNQFDSSYKRNNLDKSVKTSINKSISEINSNNISKISQFKRSNSIIESRKIKNLKMKNNCQKKENNILFYKKSNNNHKKTYLNNNNINGKSLNKKKLNKNYKYHYRNSMNNFFQSISSIKSNNNNLKQKMNLKTSKITNFFNDSYLNNENKSNNKPKNKNIKISKSIEMKDNNIYQNNLFESFKSLNSEVEKFENKYKKMKRDSCERKKKIKQLLMGRKNSSEKIKSLKHQLNYINNNSQQFEDINIKNKNQNIYIRKISEEEIKSKTKDNNINNNKNNFQNRKENISFFEFNINNIYDK